ncbi:helix-turn-helix domain-containing protein [Mucilaginibacter flavus]|uniref:helix-turn-helix domain-containing protein n=1 Tax=Mucilaginibacter flavus TaxID=931504 RepID=UPI0025B2FF3D|nr:AraC family transcriptional regulator [Mucilaginibacter flavus]MDN3584642.1 AraC family transcriptional regulator [Mucilaginibacter flavus]
MRNFRGYKSYLVAHFADLQGIELGWLRGLIAFIATALFVLGCFYIADLFIPLSYIVNWYPYLLLGLSIYYISINGYFYSPGLFRHLQFSITKIDEQFKTPALPDIAQWKQNLDKFMVIEQPFLDSEINLALLARKLGTNTQILSKVINEGYGQNFNDYINGLRVKAVIEQFRLQAHEKYNLMGIAWDCGFNSKTTFNRAFKKVIGQTPTVFIEQLDGSDHDLNP